MRLLTITSSYPKFAGDTTAPFIESITRELAERGHEITLVLPARSDLTPRAIEGVRFRPFAYAPVPALEVFGYAEALRADEAVRVATYLMAPWAVLSGMRAVRQELRSRPYDAIHAHWVVPGGAVAVLGAGGSPVPLVVSLHGSDVFVSENKRLLRAMARRTFHRARSATACSDDLAERSLALGARMRPEIIPYGVDTERFRPRCHGAPELRRRLGLEASDPVLLGVGRLVRKKGFEYLVDAAAELVRRGQRLTIVLAGKGDLARELECRASAQGIGERVKFLGNVDREELPELFALADVVVVPSIRDPAGNVDGLPNVLLEAMASGRPIAASDVGGIPQAIRSGRDGLLIPEKNALALAEAIERILSTPELGRALGAEARRRAEEAFSWKQAGERFESVLGSVAEARSP